MKYGMRNKVEYIQVLIKYYYFIIILVVVLLYYFIIILLLKNRFWRKRPAKSDINHSSSGNSLDNCKNVLASSIPKPIMEEEAKSHINHSSSKNSLDNCKNVLASSIPKPIMEEEANYINHSSFRLF